MPNPVVVEFLLKGMPEVARALKTVEQAAASAERARASTAQRASQQRTKLEEQEAKAKIRAMLKADAEARRVHDRAVRDAERAARATTRVEEQAAKVKIRATQKADTEQRRAQERAVRETERAARQRVRIEEQAAKAEERAVARSQANMLRIRERSATMAGRLAVKQAREDERARKEQSAAREKFGRGIASHVLTGVGKAGSAAMGMAHATAGLVSQLGGGFSVADAVQRQANLERSAVALSNTAFQGTGARMKPEDIISQAKAAATLTGNDAGDVLAAAHAFAAKTGSAEEGLANMKLFGQISKGTGASLEDVANTAGILRVQNKNLGAKEMEAILLQTIRQGQQGSVEFSDLAKVAGKVTKSATSFAGGTQGEMQGKLLGLAQIAMRTAGSPEEAATVLSNISADAMKHAEDVTDVLGKKAFNEKGQIAKSPEEFIADVMAKTGGNLQKVQAMGFGSRSMKMFQALAPTFNDAEKEKAGSGRDAILKEMREVMVGTMPMSELEDNVKKILNTSAEQFQTAMRDLRTVVGTELLPELVKLVPLIKEATPHLSRLLEAIIRMAQWAEKNPFAGMGLAVSGFVLKEIAAAQIGNVIKNAIAAAAGGLPGAGGAGAAGSGIAGAGGAGAGLLASGAIAVGGVAQVAYLGQQADRVWGAKEEGQAKAAALAKRATEGPVGLTEAQAAIKQAQADASLGNQAMSLVSGASRLTAYANPMAMLGQFAGDKFTEAVTGKESADTAQMKRTIAAREIIDSEAIKKAIADAVRDGAKQGVSSAGAGAPGKPAAASAGIVQRTQ